MVLVETSSGIRGLYGEELSLEVAERYSKAFENFLVEKNLNSKIVIGRDTRESGESLFNAFIKNLNIEVINVGVLPTPVIQNAVRAFGADGGVIISGSHLEPKYNGMKLLHRDGAHLRPKDMEKVIKSSKIQRTGGIGNPKIQKLQKEALQHYIEFVKEIIGEIDFAKINFVLDPNGGAGVFSKPVLESFGVDAYYINMEQGVFNRIIEPGIGNALGSLQKEIKKHDSDFAAGFDCDADRVEILLKDGSLMGGNEILGIITEDILSKHNGKPVVVNDATSYVVKEIANKYNSNFIEVEVGETNVVEEMKRVGSLVGGEGSNGGVIVGNSKCRDGILGVLYLLKILIKHKTNLNSLINKLPKYYYLKYKFKLNKDFSLIRKELIEYYLEKGFEVMMTGDSSGGLKFLKNQSWVWFRQSKTEDKMIRIVTNSKDEEIAENLLKEARILLQQAF